MAAPDTISSPGIIYKVTAVSAMNTALGLTHWNIAASMKVSGAGLVRRGVFGDCFAECDAPAEPEHIDAGGYLEVCERAGI